jgi:hypothetical protein
MQWGSDADADDDADGGHRGSDGSEAVSAEIAADWAALRTQAPDKPAKGKPPPEQLAALQAHSRRRKDFLAGLSEAQRYQLTAKRQPAASRQRSESAERGDQAPSEAGQSPRPGQKRVAKQYLACVYGCIAEQLRCDKALTRELRPKERWQARANQTVMADAAAAAAGESQAAGTSTATGVAERKKLECSTVFRREAALWMHEGAHRVSLVRCELQTGRRHQIRRHLASLGHPIFGDNKYGQTKTNAWLKKDYGLHRVFLHAAVLEFDHPFVRGRRVRVESVLPAELSAFLRRLPESELAGISSLMVPPGPPAAHDRA